MAADRPSRRILARILWVPIFASACGGSGSPLAPAAPTSPLDPSFSIVLFPDTQFYSAGVVNPEAFRAQGRWVADHAADRRIAAVIGLGDIVNSPREAEWARADDAFRPLESAQIPYVGIIGNHDYDSLGRQRDSRSFNAHFGLARYQGFAWFGWSSYPQGSADNSYFSFTAFEQRYLVLCLEVVPRDSALEWAQGVLDANRSASVIVATHAYLDDLGRQLTDVSTSITLGAAGMGLEADNNGAELWEKLISRNPQIILVVCGHAVPRWRVDMNHYGAPVPQIMADYQSDGGGGSGKLRILDFHPAIGTIENITYSPFQDKEFVGPEDRFTVPYQGSFVARPASVDGWVQPKAFQIAPPVLGPVTRGGGALRAPDPGQPPGRGQTRSAKSGGLREPKAP